MALNQFLEERDPPERSLVVVNRTEPEPFQVLLENLFEMQDVAIEEKLIDEYDDDTVLLVEDNETIVETSPLSALEDAILMVNSDLFITGTVGLEETDVPAVIDGLADQPFTLRGYPESNKEKLLLILISRQIEQIAFEHGEGTIRSSFQSLSRIDDEQGTRDVYERLAESAVDVHVYGRPDWTPSPEFSVTMHGGYSQDFRESWFVVFNPPDRTNRAALLAIQRDDGHWDGFWTYEGDRVGEIAAHIRREL